MADTVFFHNQSSYAEHVQWAFGDGHQSTEPNPYHLYDTTGNYEVCQMINGLGGSWGDTVCLTVSFILSGIDDYDAIDERQHFSFYPNPMTDMGTLEFKIFRSANVEVAIYDMLGQKQIVLANGMRLPASYRLIWRNNRLASGTYFIQLKIGEQRYIEKISLLR